MQKQISTNLHIPEDLWKEVKIEAVHQGKTMREIVLEGIRLALGKKTSTRVSSSATDFLLQFSGKASAKIKDASVNHDDYIYG